jgi:methyl-accepting chemotaxis protein
MGGQKRVSLLLWIFVAAFGLGGVAGAAMGAAMASQLSGSIGGDVEAILSRDLERAVIRAAAQLNSDELAALMESRDVKSPAYEKGRGVLTAVQREFNLKTDIYTLHPIAGATEFGLTAKADPLLGNRYLLREEMRPVFEGKKAVARTGVYEDDHGAWVSAYAALTASDGRVIGLVEADHDLVPYVRANRQRVLRALLLAILLGFGLAIPLAFLGSRALVKPIRELSAVAEKVSQGDVDDAEVNSNAPGEIGALAQSFERAIVATRYFIKRVEELESGEEEALPEPDVPPEDSAT